MKILRESGEGVFISQVLTLSPEDDDDEGEPGTYAIDSAGRVWKLDKLFSGIVESALYIPPDDRPRPKTKRKRARV